MKQEVADIWAEALESGEYPKGRAYLKAEIRGEFSFCCLGVLCDLYLKAHPEQKVEWVLSGNIQSGGLLTYIFRIEDAVWERHGFGLIPNEVQEWAGLYSGSGDFKDKSKDPLWRLNDNYKGSLDFPGIARIIRENVHNL